MNSMSREPKIGELSNELFEFNEVNWKISKFNILPNNPNYDFPSPPFFFAGATWILRVSPFGRTETNSVGWIDLGIERLNTKIPEHHVFSKFYFKTHRGKEFEPYQETYSFNSNCRINWMMYIEKDIFTRKENVVTKEGIITIVCQMRTPKICGIEKFSQTPLVKPAARTSKEKSTQEPDPSASTSKDCDSVSVPENKILQDFKELFLKQEDCDVLIKVKGKEFPAHKNILKSRSPVFASTLRNDMKEKATGIINIEDCDPLSFSDFLCFLYCGNVENLSAENVFSLFTVADKYDVKDLRQECLAFMKKNLSVDTFCDTVTLAFQHFEKDLIAMSADFFAKHLQEIIVTVKWQSFVIENPVQSNEIMIKSLVASKK